MIIKKNYIQSDWEIERERVIKGFSCLWWNKKKDKGTVYILFIPSQAKYIDFGFKQTKNEILMNHKLVNNNNNNNKRIEWKLFNDEKFSFFFSHSHTKEYRYW